MKGAWSVPVGLALTLLLGSALLMPLSPERLNALAQWHASYQAASGYLLAWRLLLYALLAGFWFSLQRRCADPLRRAGYGRTGSLGLGLILLLECSRLPA